MNSHKVEVRLRRILEELALQDSATVADLARNLGVSEETIRRDARLLEADGRVAKSHGVVSLPHHMGEASFERRMREDAAAKIAIARHACNMVNDGDSLIIDTGTTTTYFARELRQRRGLTVITNSTDIARTLVTVKGNRVFLAGGELSAYDAAAYGTTTAEFVSRFNPKFAFISITAIDAVHGPTDASLPEADFGRVAFKAAKFNVILADANKFGRISLVKVCAFAEIDMIVTDRPPSADLAKRLADNNVELAVCGASLGA